MPAIERSEDIEVLVTGFGPFGRIDVNPSWLCTEDLHGTYLDFDRPPEQIGTHGSDSRLTSTKRVRIQTLQTSVAYSHILDLVPRIHGTTPSAPEAEVYLDPTGEQPDKETGLGAQGNGAAFPAGYRALTIPSKGYFDHVVHIGVGSPGAVAVEKLGHKRGYQVPDVKTEKAPVATSQSETVRREAQAPSADELRERSNMQTAAKGDTSTGKDPVRGFGAGYEQFKEEERTSNDVATLVHWLQSERGYAHVRQSLDPGRFLCDFIFYCSLCEAQRTQHDTRVQFVHVPPLNMPYTVKETHTIVKDIVWWLTTRQH